MGEQIRNLESSKVLEDVFHKLTLQLRGPQWHQISASCTELKEFFKERHEDLTRGMLGTIYKGKAKVRKNKIDKMGVLESPGGPMLVFHTSHGWFSGWRSYKTENLRLTVLSPRKLKIHCTESRYTKDIIFKVPADLKKFKNLLLSRGAYSFFNENKKLN